jgi:hypothetical protein
MLLTNQQVPATPVFQTEGIVAHNHCLLMPRKIAELLVTALEDAKQWVHLHNSRSNLWKDSFASDIFLSDVAVKNQWKRYLCNPQVARHMGGVSDNFHGHYRNYFEEYRPSILQQARVYVAACADRRIVKLPEQLAKLGQPYILEKEHPRSIQSALDSRGDRVFWDRCSQRFTEQAGREVERPLLWLEDDILIPDDFTTIWRDYETAIPHDWQIAVIGYLTIRGKYTKIKRINARWGELVDSSTYPDLAPRFGGTQAVLFNAGQWRTELSKRFFQADWGLGRVAKDLGLRMYFSDKRIIGTSDPLSVTVNRRMMTCDCMTLPIHTGRGGAVELTEQDYVE